jgi:hypothetical protein
MLFILLGESRVIAASGLEKNNRDVQQKEITLVHTKLCASGSCLKALAWSLPQCRQQATAPGACSSLVPATGNMFGMRRECSAARMCWCWMLSAAGRCSYRGPSHGKPVTSCSCLPSNNASISREGTLCMPFILLGESRVIALVQRSRIRLCTIKT